MILFEINSYSILFLKTETYIFNARILNCYCFEIPLLYLFFLCRKKLKQCIRLIFTKCRQVTSTRRILHIHLIIFRNISNRHSTIKTCANNLSKITWKSTTLIFHKFSLLVQGLSSHVMSDIYHHSILPRVAEIRNHNAEMSIRFLYSVLFIHLAVKAYEIETQRKVIHLRKMKESIA